jgi:hypothetical protein
MLLSVANSRIHSPRAPPPAEPRQFSLSNGLPVPANDARFLAFLESDDTIPEANCSGTAGLPPKIQYAFSNTTEYSALRGGPGTSVAARSQD